MSGGVHSVADSEFFSAVQDGNVLAVRSKKHMANLAGDLGKMDAFHNFFESVAHSRQIKVLARFGSPRKQGFADGAEFIRNVLKADKRQYLLQRFFNLVNNYVMALADLDKATINADYGLVSIFQLNVSLAYDYRIVAEGTVFENTTATLGLVPKGGGGYFMSRMLGVKKATEVLQWSRFSAEDALQLGLVDRIVPLAELERETLNTAKRYSESSLSTLLGVRKLLKSDRQELQRSLELEDLLILKRVNDPSFSEDFEALCREHRV